MTNYDKIRSWGPGELAEFLEKIVDCNVCPAEKACLEWRKEAGICNCSKTLRKWMEEEAE